MCEIFVLASCYARPDLSSSVNSMKKVLTIWLIAVLASVASAAERQQYQRIATIFPGVANSNINAVTSLQAQSAIVLVGEITPFQTAEFKRHAAAMPAPKILYIDSGGGDLLSALEIANFVREHDMRVIVAGRCLSACANYIFAGARSKVVMPGSLVGIHSTAFTYFRNNVPITINRLDTRSTSLIKADATLRRQVEDIDRREREFYARTGISTAYHDAYSAYETARARSKEPVSAACPRLKIWILTRDQFESIGVRGIDHFWQPASRADANAAAVWLDLKPDEVFFGSAADLGKLCQPSRKQRVRPLS